MREAMRVMGLDHGSVRMGVAISDATALFAQPLEVIDVRRVNPIHRLVDLVQEYEVVRLVVGLPLRLHGEAGPAVQAVESFVALLEPKLTVPIVWWDERLTTAAAQRCLIDANVRRQDRRQRIDKVAAAMLLQSYLDAQPSWQKDS